MSFVSRRFDPINPFPSEYKFSSKYGYSFLHDWAYTSENLCLFFMNSSTLISFLCMLSLQIEDTIIAHFFLFSSVTLKISLFMREIGKWWVKWWNKHQNRKLFMLFLCHHYSAVRNFQRQYRRGSFYSVVHRWLSSTLQYHGFVTNLIILLLSCGVSYLMSIVFGEIKFVCHCNNFVVLWCL